MDQRDAIQLIEPAEIGRNTPSIWADLGCGSGTFTHALAALLPPHSSIYAIDQQQQSMAPSGNRYVDIHFQQANFEKENLILPPLNGILMANALHYIEDKKSLVKKLEALFVGPPQFIIIEYDTLSANPWVPYPIDYRHLWALFTELGYSQIAKLGERPSVYGRANLYACSMQK